MPSLTGCYLLVIVSEPFSQEHKERIVQKVAKGLLSWDIETTGCDLVGVENVCKYAEPEEGSDMLIQHATENLAVEVLLNPEVTTVRQCLKNLLSSTTKHKHLIHAGYSFSGSGAWLLQDGTYSFRDFSDTFRDTEVLRILKAYPGCSIHVHCTAEGDWSQANIDKHSFSRLANVALNPPDKISSLPGSAALTECLESAVVYQPLEEIMKSSSIVGNIRFHRPTLYVFPGGQGDCALFGVSGFNMLIDGGFTRKPCFWEFIRHLDRLDAVLVTRLSESNLNGVTSMFKRKALEKVFPQVGYVFCNIAEVKYSPSDEMQKDRDELLVSVIHQGHEFLDNLYHSQLKPHLCYRASAMEPFTLYNKVGHGTLEMYVISPPRESRELKDFLYQWASFREHFSFVKTGMKFNEHDLSVPLCHAMSICALMVWRPADPKDTISRILFPGSAPQSKIFEGLEKLKNLNVLNYPLCTASSLRSASVEKSKFFPEKPFARMPISKPRSSSPASQILRKGKEGSPTRKETPTEKKTQPSEIIKTTLKRQDTPPKKTESNKEIQEKKNEQRESRKAAAAKKESKVTPTKPTEPKKPVEPKSKGVKDVVNKKTVEAKVISRRTELAKTKSPPTPPRSPIKQVKSKTPTSSPKHEPRKVVKRPTTMSVSEDKKKEKEEIKQIAAEPEVTENEVSNVVENVLQNGTEIEQKDEIEKEIVSAEEKLEKEKDEIPSDENRIIVTEKDAEEKVIEEKTSISEKEDHEPLLERETPLKTQDEIIEHRENLETTEISAMINGAVIDEFDEKEEKGKLEAEHQKEEEDISQKESPKPEVVTKEDELQNEMVLDEILDYDPGKSEETEALIPDEQQAPSLMEELEEVNEKQEEVANDDNLEDEDTSKMMSPKEQREILQSKIEKDRDESDVAEIITEQEVEAIKEESAQSEEVEETVSNDVTTVASKHEEAIHHDVMEESLRHKKEVEKAVSNDVPTVTSKHEEAVHPVVMEEAFHHGKEVEKTVSNDVPTVTNKHEEAVHSVEMEESLHHEKEVGKTVSNDVPTVTSKHEEAVHSVVMEETLHHEKEIEKAGVNDVTIVSSNKEEPAFPTSGESISKHVHEEILFAKETEPELHSLPRDLQEDDVKSDITAITDDEISPMSQEKEELDQVLEEKNKHETLKDSKESMEPEKVEEQIESQKHIKTEKEKTEPESLESYEDEHAVKVDGHTEQDNAFSSKEQKHPDTEATIPLVHETDGKKSVTDVDSKVPVDHETETSKTREKETSKIGEIETFKTEEKEMSKIEEKVISKIEDTKISKKDEKEILVQSHETPLAMEYDHKEKIQQLQEENKDQETNVSLKEIQEKLPERVEETRKIDDIGKQTSASVVEVVITESTDDKEEFFEEIRSEQSANNVETFNDFKTQQNKNEVHSDEKTEKVVIEKEIKEMKTNLDGDVKPSHPLKMDGEGDVKKDATISETHSFQTSHIDEKIHISPDEKTPKQKDEKVETTETIVLDVERTSKTEVTDEKHVEKISASLPTEPETVTTLLDKKDKTSNQNLKHEDKTELRKSAAEDNVKEKLIETHLPLDKPIDDKTEKMLTHFAMEEISQAELQEEEKKKLSPTPSEKSTTPSPDEKKDSPVGKEKKQTPLPVVKEVYKTETFEKDNEAAKSMKDDVQDIPPVISIHEEKTAPGKDVSKKAEETGDWEVDEKRSEKVVTETKTVGGVQSEMETQIFAKMEETTLQTAKKENGHRHDETDIDTCISVSKESYIPEELNNLVGSVTNKEVEKQFSDIGVTGKIEDAPVYVDDRKTAAEKSNAEFQKDENEKKSIKDKEKDTEREVASAITETTLKETQSVQEDSEHKTTIVEDTHYVTKKYYSDYEKDTETALKESVESHVKAEEKVTVMTSENVQMQGHRDSFTAEEHEIGSFTTKDSHHAESAAENSEMQFSKTTKQSLNESIYNGDKNGAEALTHSSDEYFESTVEDNISVSHKRGSDAEKLHAEELAKNDNQKDEKSSKNQEHKEETKSKLYEYDFSTTKVDTSEIHHELTSTVAHKTSDSEKEKTIETFSTTETIEVKKTTPESVHVDLPLSKPATELKSEEHLIKKETEKNKTDVSTEKSTVKETSTEHFHSEEHAVKYSPIQHSDREVHENLHLNKDVHKMEKDVVDVKKTSTSNITDYHQQMHETSLPAKDSTTDHKIQSSTSESSFIKEQIEIVSDKRPQAHFSDYETGKYIDDGKEFSSDSDSLDDQVEILHRTNLNDDLKHSIQSEKRKLDSKLNVSIEDEKEEDEVDDEMVRHPTPPGQDDFYSQIGASVARSETYKVSPRSKIEVRDEPLYEEPEEDPPIEEHPVYGKTLDADYPEFVSISEGTTPSEPQSPSPSGTTKANGEQYNLEKSLYTISEYQKSEEKITDKSHMHEESLHTGPTVSEIVTSTTTIKDKSGQSSSEITKSSCLSEKIESATSEIMMKSVQQTDESTTQHTKLKDQNVLPFVPPPYEFETEEHKFKSESSKGNAPKPVSPKSQETSQSALGLHDKDATEESSVGSSTFPAFRHDAFPSDHSSSLNGRSFDTKVPAVELEKRTFRQGESIMTESMYGDLQFQQDTRPERHEYPYHFDKESGAKEDSNKQLEDRLEKESTHSEDDYQHEYAMTESMEMTTSFIGSSLSEIGSQDTSGTIQQGASKKPSSFHLEDWGKPMGLPSPPDPCEVQSPNSSKSTLKSKSSATPIKSVSNKLEEEKKNSRGSLDNGKPANTPIKSGTAKPDKGTPTSKGKNTDGHVPIYVDLTYVPHHGDPHYCDINFFKRIRARYYVFSGTSPSKEVFNALLEAKKSWEDKTMEVTVIPTYETDTLGYWMALNQEALAELKIDVAPSASRCTISLQDHETSCAAYRLEF